MSLLKYDQPALRLQKREPLEGCHSELWGRPWISAEETPAGVPVPHKQDPHSQEPQKQEPDFTEPVFTGLIFMEPGLSAQSSAGTQCEGEGPVGMVLQETCKPLDSLQGSETPTGNTFLEKVRAGTIECAECGCRAQMRCCCGILICLNHAYEIDGDPRCAACVTSIREERHIQDDLTLEMYKNIARRR